MPFQQLAKIAGLVLRLTGVRNGEIFANGRVDQDLGTLKELLAVTRKAAAKGW